MENASKKMWREKKLHSFLIPLGSLHIIDKMNINLRSARNDRNVLRERGIKNIFNTTKFHVWNENGWCIRIEYANTWIFLWVLCMHALLSNKRWAKNRINFFCYIYELRKNLIKWDLCVHACIFTFHSTMNSEAKIRFCHLFHVFFCVWLDWKKQCII